LGELANIHAEHLVILQRWQTSFESGRLNKIKEVSLHGEFLTDISAISKKNAVWRSQRAAKTVV